MPAARYALNRPRQNAPARVIFTKNSEHSTARRSAWTSAVSNPRTLSSALSVFDPVLTTRDASCPEKHEKLQNRTQRLHPIRQA